MARIRVNISIEEEVRDKAQDAGLNVSRICELALREALKQLENKSGWSKLKTYEVDGVRKIEYPDTL